MRQCGALNPEVPTVNIRPPITEELGTLEEDLGNEEFQGYDSVETDNF